MERDQIIPQKQQGHRDRWQDYSNPSLPQERYSGNICTTQNLNELNKELGTQNWDNFVKEIKTTFSDKTKAVDAE